MRMGRKIVALAIVDLLVFIATWVPRGLHMQPWAGLGALLYIVYLISMWLGIALTVYGFLILIKGRPEQLRAAVLCTLFGLVPGCAGLIALLSQLGTHPV